MAKAYDKEQIGLYAQEVADTLESFSRFLRKFNSEPEMQDDDKKFDRAMKVVDKLPDLMRRHNTLLGWAETGEISERAVSKGTPKEAGEDLIGLMYKNKNGSDSGNTDKD